MHINKFYIATLIILSFQVFSIYSALPRVHDDDNQINYDVEISPLLFSGVDRLLDGIFHSLRDNAEAGDILEDIDRAIKKIHSESSLTEEIAGYVLENVANAYHKIRLSSERGVSAMVSECDFLSARSMVCEIIHSLSGYLQVDANNYFKVQDTGFEDSCGFESEEQSTLFDRALEVLENMQNSKYVLTPENNAIVRDAVTLATNRIQSARRADIDVCSQVIKNVEQAKKKLEKNEKLDAEEYYAILGMIAFSVGIDDRIEEPEITRLPRPANIECSSNEVRYRPFGWRAFKPYEKPNRLQSYDDKYQIRTRDVYISNEEEWQSGQNALVFVVIHGTGFDNESGPNNIHYWNSGEKMDNSVFSFYNLMVYASSEARKRSKNLELLSLKWTGKNNDADRREAAIFLVNYIWEYYSDSEIGIIAHSHGCNVANLFSQVIGRPISLLIYFSCPVREKPCKEVSIEKVKNFISSIDPKKFLSATWDVSNFLFKGLEFFDDYTPGIFDQLFFFFAPNDKIAMLGAANRWKHSLTGLQAGYYLFKLGSWLTPTGIKLKLGSGIVQYGGAAMLAKSAPLMNLLSKISWIRAFGSYLSHGISKIGFKKLFYLLNLSTARGLIDQIMNSNNFHNQANRRMNGICSTLNNTGSGHQTVDLAPFLRRIFTGIDRFSLSALANAYFRVNADGDNFEQRLQSLIVFIEKAGENNLQEIPLDIINRIVGPDLSLNECLRREQALSDQIRNRLIQRRAWYNPRRHCAQM